MQHRREEIVLVTAGHRIAGTLTLSAEGYRSRASDVLNASERDFVTLTDATVEPLSGGAVTSHSVVSVSRGHIVFAIPADETDTSLAPPEQ